MLYSCITCDILVWFIVYFVHMLCTLYVTTGIPAILQLGTASNIPERTFVWVEVCNKRAYSLQTFYKHRGGNAFVRGNTWRNQRCGFIRMHFSCLKALKLLRISVLPFCCHSTKRSRQAASTSHARRRTLDAPVFRLEQVRCWIIWFLCCVGECKIADGGSSFCTFTF